MDAAEFDAFHAGTHPRLLASLTAATRDSDRAEEALEEAYARAWARRGALGRDEPAETWVLRQAARQARVEWETLPEGMPSGDAVNAALAGLARRPLPPSELRRRGGARASRRRLGVGGVLAAGLLAAATALAPILPGNGAGPGPGLTEALQVNPTPLPERPGEVAPDFDLASGLSSEGRVGPDFDLDPFPGRRVCGRPYDLGGLTSSALAVRSDDFGLESGRLLVVARELDLSDADLNARGIAERYVRRFEDCPRASDGGTVVTTSVERTLVGDQGWTISRTGADGSLEIIQVVRVGSGILVAGARRGDGDTVDPNSFQRAEAYSISPVVQRMCVWNDTGCG